MYSREWGGEGVSVHIQLTVACKPAVQLSLNWVKTDEDIMAEVVIVSLAAGLNMIISVNVYCPRRACGHGKVVLGHHAAGADRQEEDGNLQQQACPPSYQHGADRY